jgi:streptogramin lyase
LASKLVYLSLQGRRISIIRSYWRAFATYDIEGDSVKIAACLAVLAVCLAVTPAVASADGAPVTGGTGNLLLESSMDLPASQLLAPETKVQEEARRANPEAVMAREQSRAEFEGLDTPQATAVDANAFSVSIEKVAGGPPSLPGDEKITSYPTDNSASVGIADGGQALVESTTPVAVETAGGRHMPIDLGLTEAGDAFEPQTPVVAVRIPKRLGDGVALSGTHVSLTPVDAKGDALGGSEGALDGASVVYANVQTDTDAVVKPSTAGFEVDTILRSVASPSQLYFRVGLPAGASLEQPSAGGPVEVIDEGTAIATILPPGAQDAAGEAVPVSMSLAGDTLRIAVNAGSTEYQYPIEVDPEVLGADSQLTTSAGKRTNWEFFTNNGKNEPSGNFGSSEAGGILKTYGVHEYKEGEAAAWVYQTRGVSKIYEFEGETEASNKEDRIESIVELQHEGGVTEEKELLSNEAKGPVEYTRKALPEPLCPKGKESCISTSGNKENAVHFQQSVVNKPAGKYSFSDALDAGSVYISEPSETRSTTSYNNTSPEFEVEVENGKHEKEKQKRGNALWGSGSWLSEYHGAIQFIAKDPGIGVSASRLEYERAGKWEVLPESEHNYLEEGLCKGVQCGPEQKEYWTLNTHLPNGEDRIRYRAEEAFGDAKHETESLETEAAATVKVDDARPHSVFIGGLPYGNELSEKSYELTTYASDGEGTVASSGIASIELYVDGKSLKAASEGEGKCTTAKGECTASAKYKIQGSELGAGHHAIVVVAKDNAGNEERDEETISISHSTPVPLGPGSVDLESGDFTLGPTDVSLGSGLSVSRVYSSRDLTAGVEAGSPLGPQWSLSIASEEMLVELVDGSVLVTGATGSQTIFAAVLNSKGEPTGKFEAPPSDSNLTMTLEEGSKGEKLAYYLKDPAAGDSTKFVLSSTAKIWVPTQQEGPKPADKVEYLYETVEVAGKKITRPKEERGATPAKVSCSPTMEAGCRALKFVYATKTKSAIGEGPTEWGEYEGHLSTVSYEGYNPATKKMTEKPIAVAEYAYDKQGRLRAEWDPRLAPHELKTTYGYDAEGHVAALDPPGQEPWVFTYGTLTSDAGAGRLIKAAQAPVSAGLWKGEALEGTGKPTITGSRAVGGRMSVSNGTWNYGPVAYGYRWQDCNTEGKECTLILGATGPNYKTTTSDVGHTIVVLVSALNGGGSVAAASTPSGVVEPVETDRYALGSSTYPEAIAVGPDKNIWASMEGSNALDKISTSGVLLEKYSLPSKSDASSIVAGPDGKVWFTDGGTEEEPSIDTMATSGGAITKYKLPEYEVARDITVGSDSNLWFTDYEYYYGFSHIDKITTAGKITEYALPSHSIPMGIVAGPDKNLWFTEYSSSRIGKITTAGVVTEYSLPKESRPTSIAAGSDGNLWFTDYGTGKIGKITTAGTITEYSLPSERHAYRIAAGPDGNLWFTTSGNNDIGKVTISGAVTEYAEGAGSSPNGITSGPDNNIWFTESGAGDVSKAVLKPSEGEVHGPQPGWTMDYDVPVTGSGAPHNLSASEVAKWGQKTVEAPVEGTAIFPPDSPQGWPASSYTRANIYYLDEEGRVVNAAAPSTGAYGAIATTEYNETNDLVRTLSADNRAAALKEGCESESNCASASLARLLSTENTYDGEGEKEAEVAEPGTHLILSRGPEHLVKYVAGEEHYEAGEKPRESMARSLTKYFYDEGAPAENPRTKKKEAYDLATTTQSYAQLVNGEGKETETVALSTTKTSYSGQEDLGWELRAPTSVTAAPGSQNLTSKTEYYESGEAMGQVRETRTPKGASGNSAHDKKLVYYGLEENKEYAACGKHPEWAGLVCETLPAKQPETTGVPNLPVIKISYNIWDEPEVIEETFPKSGSFAEHTRTTKDEYDAAGRMKTSEETSTATTEATDKALPKVTEEYSSTTGTLEKQSTTVGLKTRTITSAYNTLGQLESYTDSDGSVAKFKYGGSENDGLLEEMSDGSDEGNSNQKYTYNATTKRLEKLVDSAAGTFTASYDTEGKLASVVYPNEMCANYGYSAVGEATHIEYTKTTSCSEKEGVWFNETKTPSIRGEMMSRTSTLAKEEYGYDPLGRLTEVHETPVGEYCKTRLYAYDEESNRAKLTTREPNSKKECATEGGVVQEHTYDEANRLTDSGITYDPLGNITKLPSGDSEGHALESTFYVDNAVATQTQNGVTDNYYLDPDGRVRETIVGGQKIITHYAGAGEAVAWTCQGSEKAEACEAAGKWTRNIPGIDGALTAVENGKGATYETPILQLHDLEGDVAATIKDKPGEAKLESTYNSTEFGVPNGGKEPPKFAWLGAGGVEKSLASGVITYGATSYVPQTGRPLQSEEVAPPGLPSGSGGASAGFHASPWNMQGIERVGSEAPGNEAGREREAAEAACRAAPESCSEDPAWSGDVSITAAEAISGALEGIEIVDDLGGGKVAEEAVEILAEHLQVNFLTQLKEVLQKGLFGYSFDEVSEWAFKVGNLLDTCAEAAAEGAEHPKKPHCWLYIPTVIRHLYKGGPSVGEIPNFAVTPTIGYCPWGTYSKCLIVNDW